MAEVHVDTNTIAVVGTQDNGYVAVQLADALEKLFALECHVSAPQRNGLCRQATVSCSRDLTPVQADFVRGFMVGCTVGQMVAQRAEW